MEEIENILNFKDISEMLNKNKDLLKNYKGKKEEIENIKKNLNSQIIKKLSELDENKVKEYLKEKINSFKINKSFHKENDKIAFYYENSKIINKEILEIIEKIIKAPNKIKIRFIVDKKGIIIFMHDGSGVINNDVSNINSLNNAIKELENKLKNANKIIENQKLEIQQLKNNINSYKNNIKINNKQIEDLKNKINELSKNNNIFKEHITKKELEIIKLKELLKDNGQNISTTNK